MVPRQTSTQGVALGLAVDLDGPLVGLLFLGKSGIGKTSLAMALYDGCAVNRTMFIADDMVLLTCQGTKLTASAPDTIVGMAEIRGYGPACVESINSVDLMLVIQLVTERQSRINPMDSVEVAGTGCMLPRLVYSVETYSWSDHAIRIRNITRSFLTGQMP